MNNKMVTAAICGVILVTFGVVSVSFVQGDPLIVSPYPDNLIVVENEKAKVTCVVTDTTGAKPDKIVFVRKDRFGAIAPILDEGPNGRIYYENKTEDGGKKLMVTLHFNKVIVKDDSLSGNHECHGYTGAKNVQYGFTVSVIPQIDLPRAVVNGTTTTFGGSANLTCDITYQGRRMSVRLEKVLWIRNFTVISQGSVAIAPITITKATTRDGGDYVCKTEVKLRRFRIIQITMGTATLKIKLKMDDGMTKVAGAVNSSVVMECPAEGYPLNVTWMRVNKDGKEVSLVMSQRYVVTRPCSSCRYRLTIYTFQSRDQGRYVCTASSGMVSGQHHFELSLTEGEITTTPTGGNKTVTPTVGSSAEIYSLQSFLVLLSPGVMVNALMHWH